MFSARQLVPRSLALLLLALPALAVADDPPAAEESHFVTRMFPRGRLGVEVLPMTHELRAHFGVDPDTGVLVSKVAPKSPAAEAGIQAGDVILRADDTPIRSTGELVRVVARYPAEEKLTIELSRDGKKRELEVELRGPSWLTPREGAQMFGRIMLNPLRELREQMRELDERLRALEEKLEQEGKPQGDRKT